MHLIDHIFLPSLSLFPSQREWPSALRDDGLADGVMPALAGIGA